VTSGVRRAAYEGGGAIVTKTLIGLNVLVFFLNLAQGSTLNRVSGSIFEKGALFISSPFYPGGLADGEWWRLITAAFLHGSLIHVGLNMLVLWIVGAPVERAIGRGRFLALYIVSGLAGSAGALLITPTEPTVGASGAIFGIMGALLVIEYLQTRQLAGQALMLIGINLLFTLSIPGISIGGHLGGLVGGILATLALARFGRGHLEYGGIGVAGIAGVTAVGLASIAVAYWKVRGYA
jgi:membrane associated rhomboid family serine protease